MDDALAAAGTAPAGPAAAEPAPAGPAAAEPALAGPAAAEPVAAGPVAAVPANGRYVPAERERGWWGRLAYRVATANTVTVTVLAVLVALVVGAVLVVISDPNVTAAYNYFFAQPGTALAKSWDAISLAYSNLFKGAVFDPDAVTGAINGDNPWSYVFAPISETLTYTAPLIFTGLSVALAFRGGLFNIGGQGQVIMGAIGAALVGFLLHLPPGLHLVVALLGGAIAGAVWGWIPGILKARTGAHEVIVTIMLNYVALYFLTWLIVQKGVQDPNRTDAISKKVDVTAHLTPLGPSPLRVHLGIVLGFLVAAGVGWMLKRSTFGFELRAVGSNPSAARTAGMGVGRTYALVMAVAGLLAGLAGANMVLGTAYSLTGSVGGSVGFDGITVALLGRGKPWGVVLAALFWGAFSAGGNRMQSAAQVPVDLVTVVQAVIVIFIAAPALVRAIFRLREDPSARLQTNLAKGW